MQIVKKRPYEFWSYRDARKSGTPKIPEVPLPVTPTDSPRPVQGLISHSILLPLGELPATLIKRLKSDLTLVNPEYEKTRKYGHGFISYSIPPYVYMYTQDSNYLALPRSCKLSYLNNRFRDSGLTLDLRDIRPEFERINWEDRGIIQPVFYQVDAIRRIVAGNVIISLSCGKGKTVLTALAIAQLRLKTLILVRNNIILKQWLDAIRQVFKVEESEIGVINGDIKREGPITVATAQSLVNYSREEKKRIGKDYGCVAVDECHEWGAVDCRELLPFFKAKRMIGLSATPERGDGLTPILKAFIGPIVEIDDLGEMNSRIHIVRTGFNYQFVRNRSKHEYHDLINALITDRDRNQLIIDTVKSYIREGRSILLYSSRIQHMETLRDMLSAQIPGLSIGVLASVVDGHALTVEEQNRIKNSVKDHQIQMLVTGKMSEQGMDAPPLGVAVLTTPTKSKRLIVQVWGRTKRDYPGKKEALLLDFFDVGCNILKWQFFSKNKKLYSNYFKTWE